MNSFRELRVWQAAMNLVEKVYRLTQRFPKQETYGLVSLIQRAAVSIPSNIAEGHTREHLKEYLHHLSMAQVEIFRPEYWKRDPIELAREARVAVEKGSRYCLAGGQRDRQ